SACGFLSFTFRGFFDLAIVLLPSLLPCIWETPSGQVAISVPGDLVGQALRGGRTMKRTLRPSTKGTRMTRRITRRTFLAAAGAALAAPAFLRGRTLNDKLNLAIIGSGGRGKDNLDALSSENVVALCDVNAKAVEAAAAKHRGAKTFTDFRKVFDHASSF